MYDHSWICICSSTLPPPPRFWEVPYFLCCTVAPCINILQSVPFINLSKCLRMKNTNISTHLIAQYTFSWQVCALSGWYCSVWCPVWCPFSWPLPRSAVVQPHQVLPEGEGQVIWCLIVIFNVLQVLPPIYDDYTITIFRLSEWCTILQTLIWLGDIRPSQGLSCS